MADIFFHITFALTSGFFYSICPSIPASLLFYFFHRKFLTGRDSESLMQTAPNCSRRLSSIDGHREELVLRTIVVGSNRFTWKR